MAGLEFKPRAASEALAILYRPISYIVSLREPRGLVTPTILWAAPPPHPNVEMLDKY